MMVFRFILLSENNKITNLYVHYTQNSWKIRHQIKFQKKTQLIWQNNTSCTLNIFCRYILLSIIQEYLNPKLLIKLICLNMLMS